VCDNFFFGRVLSFFFNTECPASARDTTLSKKIFVVLSAAAQKVGALEKLFGREKKSHLARVGEKKHHVYTYTYALALAPDMHLHSGMGTRNTFRQRKVLCVRVFLKREMRCEVRRRDTISAAPPPGTHDRTQAHVLQVFMPDVPWMQHTHTCLSDRRSAIGGTAARTVPARPNCRSLSGSCLYVCVCAR
jgi:hypothetical protein